MTRPSVEELAGVPLFGSLSVGDLEELSQQFTVRQYPERVVIASEGDRLSIFSLILAGRIQWFWTDEEGRQLKLTPEGPGGHFADTTLGGEPILMSIATIEAVRVAEISTDAFRGVLLRYPQVAVRLLMDVIARLRRMTQATRTLGMDEVYTRVVKLLLARAVPADGVPEAALTQAQIGERVGATREMVGRILRDLAHGGYIELLRGRIRILRKLPRHW
jgi:CRP/FNR family transcriptional regulator, cyclic AMP receptor protein